ncbi:ATP-dependent RNA helicase DDX54 [Orchesella cincta]|uniref:RNA helicase n=1 Tax=Orchesella cincta TaxID=48709 RepID=A0A1D2NBX4_ORCCI|nr:ATP-dependent RNA helicase DDX54 [Orchesella cincta]
MKFNKRGGGGSGSRGGGGGSKFGKVDSKKKFNSGGGGRGSVKPNLSVGFKSNNKGKKNGVSNHFHSKPGGKGGGKFSGNKPGFQGDRKGGFAGKKNGFQKFGKRNGNDGENEDFKEEDVAIKEEADAEDSFVGLESQSDMFERLHNGVKKEEEFDSDDEDNGGGGGSSKKGKKGKSGGFQNMGLSQAVLKGILRRGYNVPTPIQRKAIPPILEGRDVVAMARTGSGKTAAFLIPLFEKIQHKKSEIGTAQKFPRALILSPTRELATQTVKFIREIGKFIDFKVVSILGGESMESQFQIMHDKPDIVVATPGRFMHLCVEMELKLDGVEYAVFDEADRLFEMGFGEQLMEILKRLPENRQTVLFSATLPKLLVDFSKAGLHDPTLIRLDVDTKLPELLELTYLACRTEDKLAALLYLLKNLIDENQQTIVFTATKHHVEFIHQLLDEANVSNCYIYSSLDPSARKISLGKFRSGKCNVMIVTDIAARGIDIPILDNVINFHFPAKPKLFMHRVGRVARAGRSGTAYSIVCPDEVAFLIDLHLFLGKPLTFEKPSGDSSDSSNSVFVGRVPQDLLNDENNFIRNMMEIKEELATLHKVSKNGYSHYLRSRPPASTESNRRAKGIEINKLYVHPFFADHVAEDPMDNLISQMQSYRPNATIFEIGPKAGSETLQIMKQKRLKDQNTVEKYRNKPVNAEMGKISGHKGKDEEPFILTYLKTIIRNSVGTTFDKQVQEAVMDLTGDDSDKLKQQQSMQKWDMKKKRFVSVGNHSNAKKIKTESGVWIAASYKSDRYQAWMRKSKTDVDNDDEGSDDDSFARNSNDDSKRKPAFSKRLVKTGKNDAPHAPLAKGRRFKTEIKRPEQILKERKVKEKKLMKNLPKNMRKQRQNDSGKGKNKSRGSGGKRK